MPIILDVRFTLNKTNKFSVIDILDLRLPNGQPLIPVSYKAKNNWESEYTENIVNDTCKRRPWFKNTQAKEPIYTLQLGDFENIDWESVLANQSLASSYLVRKGLSRKAQLALQIKRYLSKHPNSILKRATPETLIVETWNAFEEMKLDFGRGTFASFDLPQIQSAPLRNRLEWSLGELKESMEDKDDKTWILKPSVTNKGIDISLIQNFDELVDRLEETPDMREWVLQEYLQNPLLILNGHKFHLRVYVLCVGALRVFVYDEILVLTAAHKYNANDLDDMFSHLTNTARAVEDVNFDEVKFVKILRDLPSILVNEYPEKFSSLNEANKKVQSVVDQVHSIVHDLYQAYENEYSIFCPMSQCFELYGLDFLIDDNFNVVFLEANPGPDFKQTGQRLQHVITRLWEQTFRLVVDSNVLIPSDNLSFLDYEKYFESYHDQLFPDFSLVYNKEWSVASLKSGLSLN